MGQSNHSHQNVTTAIFVGSPIVSTAMLLSAELMKLERYEFNPRSGSTNGIIYDRETVTSTVSQEKYMLEILRSQSRSASGAIMYVTVGTLMVIWSGLWYCYFIFPMQNPPAWQSYACVSTIFSGVAVAVIGLLFGIIGRGAKEADNAVGVATTKTVTPTLEPIAGSSHLLASPVLAEAPLLARQEDSVMP